MNRHLAIHGSIKAEEYSPEAASIMLLFGEQDAWPLCVELILLDYGLVSAITVTQKSDQKTLRLSLGGNEPSLETTLHAQQLIIKLCRHALQAIISFLLQFFRDRYWAANHVDIELTSCRSGFSNQEVSFIVQTDQPPQAISGDEAKRLLGLE